MPDSICSIDGCERPVHNLRNQWCRAHYQRWRRHGNPLGGRTNRAPNTCTLEERFRFVMPGNPPPAGVPWRWAGPIHHSGYGVLGYGRQSHLAHRVSYEIFVGSIPDGLVVRHKNDLKWDVNPNNLEVGTLLDNTHDMFERGRANKAKGVEHGLVKLSDAEVLDIRVEYETRRRTQRAIADEYGISQSLVSMIVNRKVWDHI